MTSDARRRVVSLPGPHGGGAGRLVTLGGMLFSSSIPGVDADTGRLAATPGDQIRAAFANLRHLLGEAGAESTNVGLLTVALPEEGHTAGLEAAWSDLFPDPDTAPVRKINTYPLPGGQRVQIQAVGSARGPRRTIGLPGFADPLLRGVRLGDTVFSGAIDGRDPATGRRSAERATEMRQAFRNMEAFVEAAGATKADLIHVFIFVRGRDDQRDMLAAWLEAFPQDGDRPARKAIFDPTLEGEGMRILLLCVAVAGGGPRVNLEVPGISKRHPNPMGCRIGDLVFSSGIGGDDPGGQATGQDPGRRAALALRNMQTLMEVAGGGLADIGMVSITVNDYADEGAILAQWQKVFPDPDDAPARHVMAFGGRGSYPVQLHMIGALDQA